jgi:hypothetical protein
MIEPRTTHSATSPPRIVIRSGTTAESELLAVDEADLLEQVTPVPVDLEVEVSERSLRRVSVRQGQLCYFSSSFVCDAPLVPHGRYATTGVVRSERNVVIA